MSTTSKYNHIIEALGLTTKDIYNQNVEHFTNEEGESRDKIVLQYFGEDGMDDLITSIVSAMGDQEVRSLLDLGSGSGTFLLPVSQKVVPDTVVAFDVTPKMLQIVKEKYRKHLDNKFSLFTVIGDMEQITKSIDLNREVDPELPTKYTNILSTLALHHVPDTDKVFQGIADSLVDNGTAILIDVILSDTSRMEPSEEHAYDGFEIDYLRELAHRYFETYTLQTLDVKCQETATKDGTDLFLLTLRDPK